MHSFEVNFTRRFLLLTGYLEGLQRIRDNLNPCLLGDDCVTVILRYQSLEQRRQLLNLVFCLFEHDCWLLLFKLTLKLFLLHLDLVYFRIQLIQVVI